MLLPALTTHGQPSPYAGQQSREIKSLSADETAGYLAGRGMGLARPAELNGYPGPRHVLDAATELALSPAQVADLGRAFDAMKARAIPLGKELVAKEAELDRLFSHRQATDAKVRELTRAVGALQGELRAAHLVAHLATVKILTPAQIGRYNRLRGYEVPAAASDDTSDHPVTP